MLDRYHGLPNGMFSADEHYCQTGFITGHRLCAVVEALFSLQQAIRVTGDAALADRLKRIAFNALPATLSADMWRINTISRPNQVLCTLTGAAGPPTDPSRTSSAWSPTSAAAPPTCIRGGRNWSRASGCRRSGKGLVALTYAPSEVRTLARRRECHDRRGHRVPFRDAVRFTVTPASTVSFPLMLRIPGWAADASLTVNGARVSAATSCALRDWIDSGKPAMSWCFACPWPRAISASSRQSVAVERGPLVFRWASAPQNGRRSPPA